MRDDKEGDNEGKSAVPMIICSKKISAVQSVTLSLLSPLPNPPLPPCPRCQWVAVVVAAHIGTPLPFRHCLPRWSTAGGTAGEVTTSLGH
jgi:hypothetical protein